MSQPPEDPAAQPPAPPAPDPFAPPDSTPPEGLGFGGPPLAQPYPGSPLAQPYGTQPYGTQPYGTQPYGAAPPPPGPWEVYGHGYAQPPEPPRQPGTDGFAVAAFVLGLIGIVPLAVIFGIVGLRRIGRSHQGGKSLAIAGLAITGAWILIGVAIAVVAALGAVGGLTGPQRGNDGAITSAGRIATTDLRVGDCIQFPSGTTTSIKTFDAVPCSTPHDAEAYAGGTLPLTGDWPGETAVQNATDAKCSDAFQPFIGANIDDSALSVSYFYPEQDAWQAGDRGYICVVGADGTKTTGTLKGADR